MSHSRARLVLSGREGTTCVVTAAATVPQRWTIAPRDGGRWLDAIHQVLGDGLFAGDRLHTSIQARVGAVGLVRGLAATPLRRGSASLSLTRIVARDDARVLYMPGALVPHAGSAHTGGLTLDAARGGCILAASVIVPGRTGSGEAFAFDQLRLRTTARLDGRTLFAEDAAVGRSDAGLAGPAGFAGAGAVVSVVSLGHWPPADTAWWRLLCLPPEIAGGASELAAGCLVFRGLCASLGVAQQFLDGLAARVTAEQPREGTEAPTGALAPHTRTCG